MRYKSSCVLLFVFCIFLGVGSVTPTIAGRESNSYLFSVRNAIVKLKNVKLDASRVANALQILKNSTVELINCTISNGESTDGRGIVVNSGASVLIDGCNFTGLHVAVCCYPGSQVCIKNSNMKNCVFGIEVCGCFYFILILANYFLFFLKIKLLLFFLMFRHMKALISK